MTRFQAEAGSTRPGQIAAGPKEVNLSTPKPLGFNGSSPEAGIKKGIVVPVFKNLGELVVTSLPTTKDNSNGNVHDEGSKGNCSGSCHNTCAFQCSRSCSCTCGNCY